MGRNKRTSVADTYYSQYTQLGRRFKNNQSTNMQGARYALYWRVLSELAINRFKWVGLPDEIDPRFLELSLYRQALCVFFKDDEYNRFFALRATGSGKINMYDNPTSFTVNGNLIGPNRILQAGRTPLEINGVIQRDETGAAIFKDAECVPIWSNYMRIPDYDIVNIYAQQLAEIDQTIAIGIKNARMPVVITTDENKRLSWVNIMREREKGEAVILGTNSLDPSQAQAFDVNGHPDMLGNLQVVRRGLWNDCMGLLGINNANQDKKERLVESEVNANDEQVDSIKLVNLKARRESAARINKRYNLTVSVGYSTQLEPKMPFFEMGEQI